MKDPKIVDKKLTSLFKHQPCWQIEPLAMELEYSVPSTRRILAATGYYASFTDNGKWYTLKTIPKFDKDGLWFHNAVGFSCAGSLTASLVSLVERSPSGLDAEALAEKLHGRCHSVLVNLVRQGRLSRGKQGRSFVYRAADPAVSAKQRHAAILQRHSSMPLPTELAVQALVEFINFPDASFEDLAKAVSCRCRAEIEVSQIESLFARYGLKKTASM